MSANKRIDLIEMCIARGLSDEQTAREVFCLVDEVRSRRAFMDELVALDPPFVLEPVRL